MDHRLQNPQMMRLTVKIRSNDQYQLSRKLPTKTKMKILLEMIANRMHSCRRIIIAAIPLRTEAHRHGYRLGT